MLSKSIYRNAKYVEKGLTFTTLFIHLPPPSDDIVGGSRDARDVLDENISRAQVIYNIIASTYTNSKWGKNVQSHISFEIVGVAGLVSMYASVPLEMLEVVKQAVTSAYPTARLEEVEDFNIFQENSSFDRVSGGEFQLKQNFAYPIATFQDLKRDTMQSLLNALSSLQKDDSVAIQILLRPAHDSWRKQANEEASKKRKGKSSKSGYEMVGDTFKQMAVALVKAPEDSGKETPKEELSGIDRSIVDAIEDKTRHPGFETAIRLVVSSGNKTRAEAINNNVVASFSLYDLPGKNGFKFNSAKDNRELVSAFVMRAFPINQNSNILNVVELATIFHFPDQSNIPTSQLGRQESKQVDGPRNMPEKGLLLGYNIFRGAKKPIRISDVDRQRHIYAVGQTGTGKSTFLEDIALQDMLNGRGFAFVDPHGDTAEKLLAMVPRERVDDVVYFSPADMDHPLGLNLFEFHSPDQKDFLIQEALNMLYKLYDPQHQGIMGPRYEHLFRNAALTVMADPAGGTFIDIPKLFRDPTYVKQKLQHVKDPSVLEFWQKEMPQSQRSNEFGDVVSWFVSKFGAFLSNEMMRNIIGQPKSAFDLRDIMDNGKILLVNLSKGRTGQLNMQLLGMIFVMKFQAAAMSRANVPEEQRRDFSLFVDEFQNFSTDSFATIMSEARKYHLNIIVANQFTTQLSEEIRDAVFGNVGTTVSFRVGDRDADSLHKYFSPTFEDTDLLRLPNYNTIVRTMVNGVPTQPFSMATLPPLGKPNPKLSAALKQLSGAKYGKPRKMVEADIFERMKTKAPSVPPASGPASSWPKSANTPSSSAPLPSGKVNPAPQKPASFLDEWLSKRKTTKPSLSPSAPTPSPTNAKPPTQPQAPAIGQPAKPLKPEGAKDNNKMQPAVSPPKPESLTNEGRSSTHKVIQPLHDLHKPLAKKNISSEALEIEEINEIAHELKKDLGSKNPQPKQFDAETTKPESVNKSETQNEAVDEAEALKTISSNKENNKQNNMPTTKDSGDTISIDHEGNITFND